MTNRSAWIMARLTEGVRSPRGGALLAALLTLAILLPLWMVAIAWYRTELLSAEPGRLALLIFEAGGFLVMALLAGLVYLSVNRQALLLLEVQQRTKDITRHNQRLEEDLARRAQVEEELRASESRSQALLSAIPDGMFRIDQSGIFLDYRADEGVPVIAPHPVIGGNIRQSPAPPAVVDRLLRKIGAALETNQIQTLEYSLPTAGGSKDFEARMVAAGRQEVVAIVRDITERKQAEHWLHRWAHIFEHAEWGVAIGSADGRTLEMMNPAYAKMHGYTVEELAGLPIGSVFAPGTADELRALIQAANESGHAVRESKHIHKDGTVFPVQVDLTAVKDENGQLLYRVANVQDITGRKQAEAQLRASEGELRALFAAMPDVILVLDAQGRYLRIAPTNPSFSRRPDETLIGQTLHDVFPPDEADEFLKTIQTALHSQQLIQADYNLLVDGEIIWYTATFSPMPDNTVLLVTRDITERKRSEEALRRSQQQYESLVNSIDGIVWEGDAQTSRFTFVSPPAERILGYPVERWLSEPAFWSDHLHPDDQAWVVDFCATETAALRPHQCEYRMLSADGRTVWLRETVAVTAENNQPKLLRGMLIDITERKLVEEALREREEQYRSIFETVSDGLFIDTLEGQIIDFNPAVARMHGYAAEEFGQIPTRQIIHPDSLYLFDEFVETVKAGRAYRCRAVDVRKDGSQFPVEVTGTPIVYRGQQHRLAVLHDITGQVQAEQLLEQRVSERTSELRALLDISTTVASTLELQPLLSLILDQLKVLVDYQGAALFALRGTELALLEYRGSLSGEYLRLPAEWWTLNLDRIRRDDFLLMPDTQGNTPWAVQYRDWAGDQLTTLLSQTRTLLALPLTSKDAIVGLISLTYDEPDHFTEQHINLVRAIANQAAVAIENARLFAEAQGKAVLEERQRLARELHDSVTQSLYSLTLLAEAGRRLIDLDVPQTTHYLNDMGEIAQQSLKEMRLLVHQLRPLALEREGLIGALQARLDSVEKRAGVEARFLIEGSLGNLLPALEEGLFRVAQEALNNTLKHAAARSVVVRLRGEDDCIVLEVADDGRGSTLLANEVRGGLGLAGMRERVTQLQGTLTIESAPRQGTRVTVEVPRAFKAAA